MRNFVMKRQEKMKGKKDRDKKRGTRNGNEGSAGRKQSGRVRVKNDSGKTKNKKFVAKV